MDQSQPRAAASANVPNLKWSYMDHWSLLTPRGFVAPQLGPQYLDRFYKAMVGIGFQGVDPFEFRLNALIQHFGSAKKADRVRARPRHRALRQHLLRLLQRHGAHPREPRWCGGGVRGQAQAVRRHRDRQLHRHAGRPLLDGGAGHRREDQAHGRMLEPRGGDDRGARGASHLPPRVLLRAPPPGGTRQVLRLDRSALRGPLPGHGPARHRRRRSGRLLHAAPRPGHAGSTSRTPTTSTATTTTAPRPTPSGWPRPRPAGSGRWAPRAGWSTSRGS